MVWWFLSVAWAECPAPTTSQQIEGALVAAEEAFTRLDIPGFREEATLAREHVRCLEEVLPVRVAADLHRFIGIQAFGDRDVALAQQAFAAARAIDPDYSFSTSLVPDGNPLRQEYTAIDTALLEVDAVKAPIGTLYFDGRTTLDRPTSWPTIAQFADDSGTVVWSRWVRPGETLPDYPLAPEPEPVPVAATGVDSRSKMPLALGISAGATALTTLGLYAAAGAAHGKFEDTNTPEADIDKYADRANTLSVASGITGAATLGLGVGLVLSL